MKRFFTLLAVLNVATGSTVMVASCTIAQGAHLNPVDSLLLIGKDIDTSKAIDDAKSNLQFTNYYILGDSLSDSHGIEKLVKNSFKLDIKIGTNDPSNLENYQNGSLSNGNTAAVLLNAKLGFDKIRPGIPNDYAGDFSRNYAIAGATAADVVGTAGMLLNRVTIEKQAQALVSQHKLRSTDLVLFEIGGNDLFQIIDTTDPQTELALMQQSVERIKIALFTLLNNGIRKILFSDAPNVSAIPRYNNQNTDDTLKKRANNISTEFHTRVAKMIELANTYYKNAIRNWGLYDNLSVLMTEFKARHPKGDITVNFNNLNLDFMKIIEEKMLNAQRNPALPANANIDDYFFFDIVHPTREVHQLAMEHYYQTIKEWT
ncbi:SGNH/GDSL hydrolase family protein [Spiroplasma melliferum]|uniref:Lipolytic enzyme, GDSL family n=2 Tax=Spiroplasma melliferum TaxID=2134 RepID=A0AAI9X1K0_SPIME|nr:SGNH/GDSL hydrolase family protein [Spiroplasma melliferum]KAI92995.1 lipolytic enzyme, GDSL family [Spiroplasma melliferum KC3]QCO23827.1 lipolytic enzyme, GDSL family [Spiroplasma melliferum]